ncbi:putative SNF2-like protein [Rosellinia necatrix]|uniref:Putative SNF2-like protein n=1 Tax=Rosellinia necatrix TaxID=77044 RepID=A0A1S7UMF7_ROSNE|nr:putative SNF2-like protein [Rosellinia necatrix]
MSERPHRPAVAEKCSATWTRKVTTELFRYPNGDQSRSSGVARSQNTGRWDPYNRFTNKEELTKFFSNYSYRRFCLIDHERYAKFAIRKTLEGHPDDSFNTTGEVLKQVPISDRSKEPGALEGLVEAIRAVGQQDVDAELTRDSAARASSKDDDNDSVQKIGAAAQAILTAGPNSLGPPINPCARYLKMTACGHYGRTNSTIWRSPFIPKLDNEDGRRGLLDHQVTAIVWILSRLFGHLPRLTYMNPAAEPPSSNITTQADISDRKRLKGPRYFGGILADSMGLGKTLIVVALINLLISQRLNVVRAQDGTSQHRPILLIAPNPTVANQWVEELEQVIDESILPRIVVSGPGLEPPSYRPRVVYLCPKTFQKWPTFLKYIWDETNTEASKVVIVMTMESWAHRTCTADGKEWSSSFTQQNRGFSLVIIDESYKVKNPSTKNWRSIYLLERQFTLLITATPCMNTLTDLFGLVRLLWTAPERYLKNHTKKWEHIELDFKELQDLDKLDDYSQSNHSQLAAGRPGLLAPLLCKSRFARTLNINLTRKYLRHFERLAMLKRSPSSYLYTDWDKTNTISLEGLFPKVENYTVDIDPGEAYENEYQEVHNELLITYLENLNDWGDRVDKPAKKTKKEDEEAKAHINSITRLLQLASSSLDVYDLNTILTQNGYSTLTDKVAEMREKEVNLLRLAQFLVLPTETKPETHVGHMGLVARNSPILRYILHYIDKNILTRGENEPIKKLLIIEQNVMVAFYYELVIQFLGINCRCLHAQLTFEERQHLVNSFNSGAPESCQIMIQMYTVGFAGTNLHKNCSRVLVASQSHSLQYQWQAIYRVIRVGQKSDVTVHRVKLKNSYHAFRESRQIEKILPELGARSQASTNGVLVQLLNLFQHEVCEAWHSLEGQKLLGERNLLMDDEDDAQYKDEASTSPASKKIKLEHESYVEAEAKFETPPIVKETPGSKPRLESNSKFPRMHSPAGSKKEGDPGPKWPMSTNPSSKRREPAPGPGPKPKPGDGSGGWFNGDRAARTDARAFLQRRTREAYYDEFVDLPRGAKGRFAHGRNALRRLLSYGACQAALDEDVTTLSAEPWTEEGLGEAAVLERALELMLRVRLGAGRDVAMLPFPIVERAPATTTTTTAASSSRRRDLRLRRLIGEARHTEQDLERGAGAGAGSAATTTPSKDLRETLRGVDVRRPLAQIERELEAQARFGDAVGARGGVRVKREEVEGEGEGEERGDDGGDDLVIVGSRRKLPLADPEDSGQYTGGKRRIKSEEWD